MNAGLSPKRSIPILVCCGLAACGEFVTYPDRGIPPTEVAAFSCYTRFYVVYLESCSIQAVDGARPGISELFGNTSRILPGSHWLEVAFERYFGGGGGITDVCAFDMNLLPGYGYQIKAHSLQTDLDHLDKHDRQSFYGGSIDVAAISPSGQEDLRHVSATCNFGGGSLCRQDRDCVPHPDIRCFPQAGFPFGLCKFKD